MFTLLKALSCECYSLSLSQLATSVLYGWSLPERAGSIWLGSQPGVQPGTEGGQVGSPAQPARTAALFPLTPLMLLWRNRPELLKL